MQRLLWVMSCGSGDRCLFSPDTGSSVQRWLTCTKQPSSAPTIGKSAACWPEWRRSVNRCSALRPKEQLRPPTRPLDMSRTKIDPSSSPMCRYLTLVHNAQTAKIWWTFSFGNSCSKGSSPCSVTYDMFHVVRPSWRRCTEGSFLACSVQHNYGSKHFIHVCAAQSAYVIQFQCPVFKRKCTLCSFCPRCWGEKWGRCKKV